MSCDNLQEGKTILRVQEIDTSGNLYCIYENPKRKAWHGWPFIHYFAGLLTTKQFGLIKTDHLEDFEQESFRKQVSILVCTYWANVSFMLFDSCRSHYTTACLPFTLPTFVQTQGWLIPINNEVNCVKKRSLNCSFCSSFISLLGFLVSPYRQMDIKYEGSLYFRWLLWRQF